MTTKFLSKQKIHDICRSAEGQQEVRAFVETMNTQGVTQMFIDFQKVEDFVHQMVINDLLGGAPITFNPKEYTKKNLEKQFVEFLTNKVEGYLCCIKDLENMDISHGFPMFKEFLTFYLTHPMKPITFFLWMGQFAVPFRERFENIVNFCYATWICNTQQHRKFRNMINEAIPLGVSAEVKSLSWVYENQKTYEKIDFSEIFSAIPFDRYYAELFEDNPNTQEFMNPELPNLGFASKNEIRRLTDEAFKPMILELVFKNIQSRNLEDINSEIKKLFLEKPVLVYQQYSRAIFTVKASEFARIQKELIQFFDKHNVPYTMTSEKEPVDLPLFMSKPEGNIPS